MFASSYGVCGFRRGDEVITLDATQATDGRDPIALQQDDQWLSTAGALMAAR
jgi:hypothetical protein